MILSVQIVEVPLDLIDYSRVMLREIDGATVISLRESIKQYGLLQPIIVFINEKNRYEIIFGNHRFCACKGIKNFKTISAIIRILDSPSEAIFLSLTENIQHLEMNPIREGEIYANALKNYSIKALSERLNKHVFYVEGRIRLCKNLRDDLKPHVGGVLTLTNALSISRLLKTKQLEVYMKIRENTERLPTSRTRDHFGVWSTKKRVDDYYYCVCEKCGSTHVRGVSIKDAKK